MSVSTWLILAVALASLVLSVASLAVTLPGYRRQRRNRR
jgi:hypothetical protein